MGVFTQTGRAMKAAINGNVQRQVSADKFIALIEKYEDFDTLSTAMFSEFVEIILVHVCGREGSMEAL